MSISVSRTFGKRVAQGIGGAIIAFQMAACGGGHEGGPSTTPVLLATTAIPDRAKPQACKDWEKMARKGPNYQRLVRSGLYGVTAGAIGEGLQDADILGDGAAEILGGIAAGADLARGEFQYRAALANAAGQCDAALEALTNGGLCEGGETVTGSARTVDGQIVGSVEGNSRQRIECNSIGTREAPRGLNQ